MSLGLDRKAKKGRQSDGCLPFQKDL